MAIKKSERIVCEAIDTMLRDKAALGLQDPPKSYKDEDEHSLQYLHEQINEMFAIKAAGLTHHDGACAAFRKIHNYKYVTDPTFGRSLTEEMKAQGIPAKEQEQASKYLAAIIKEMQGGSDWCERDAGYNPNLEEILDTTRKATDG